MTDQYRVRLTALVRDVDRAAAAAENDQKLVASSTPSAATSTRMGTAPTPMPAMPRLSAKLGSTRTSWLLMMSEQGLRPAGSRSDRFGNDVG